MVARMTVKIEPDLKKEIQAEAKRRGIDMSAWVRLTLTDALEAARERRQ